MALGMTACSQSVGPNKKNDALKRAKAYAVEKYGEELKGAKVVRNSKTGDQLTYNTTYIVTEPDSENPYNIIVDYNKDGEFVGIGDDKESKSIRNDFEKWATFGELKPTVYAFGEILTGGGEQTITDTIYYFKNKYNGNIEEFIKGYEGTIYIYYDISYEVENDRIKSLLKGISKGCKAEIQVNTSISKTYNMGLSVAVPAQIICSITLQGEEVKMIELKQRNLKFNEGIILSTYIDRNYKNMIEEAVVLYDSQVACLKKDILEEKNNVYKDENGKILSQAYLISKEFKGSIEVAFSRDIYSEKDVKVYKKEGELLKPGNSNDRFYYDDDNFYYLVEPGYIISITKE